MNTYGRKIGWLCFWASGGILILMVVPIMKNPGAIPMAFFAVVVLALASGLWGMGFIGRKTVVTVATITLILTSLSFFLPRTAKRVPRLVQSADDFLATYEPTNTTSPPASTTTSPPAPVTSYAPPYVQQRQPTRCSGSFEVRDNIDIPAGGFPVDLCWGWSAWPIDGPVTITTRSGKQYDLFPPALLPEKEKGKQKVIPELQMGGMAIFTAKPAGAKRTVAIKNIW